MSVQHEAIQIHHVPGQWVTSSSIGGNLAVYDSKFKGGDLSSPFTHHLALIYRLLAEREDEMEMRLTPQSCNNRKESLTVDFLRLPLLYI